MIAMPAQHCDAIPSYGRPIVLVHCPAAEAAKLAAWLPRMTASQSNEPPAAAVVLNRQSATPSTKQWSRI